MKFRDKLKAAKAKNQQSALCIGLDPEPCRLPACLQNEKNPVLKFNQEIIAATSDLVCAFKPNAAFYESLGKIGFETLEQTIAAVPKHIPVILDAKRGDIANTARHYAVSAFAHLNACAITLSPYMGADCYQPFLDYPEKAVFVLLKTSNASSGDLQNLELTDGSLLYETLARQLAGLQAENQAAIGVVAGATYPAEFAQITKLLPEALVLMPGFGAQAADLRATLAAPDLKQEQLMINSSRKVLYASAGSDFAAAAASTAQALLEEIKNCSAG